VLRNHTDTVTITLPEKFLFAVNQELQDSGGVFMMYRLPVVVAQTEARSGAEKAGLQAGDRLLAVNNDSTPSYTEFVGALKAKADSTVTLTVLRDGNLINVLADIDGNGKLGIRLTEPEKVFKTISINYGLLASIPRGIEMGWDKMVTYVKSLKLVFTKEGAQSLGGFGAIGSIFPERGAGSISGTSPRLSLSSSP